MLGTTIVVIVIVDVDCVVVVVDVMVVLDVIIGWCVVVMVTNVVGGERER